LNVVILQFKHEQMKNQRKMDARPARRSFLSLGTKKDAVHKSDLLHVTRPPDEETIQRLNSLAKQYPFCILNRYREHSPR